MDSMLQKNQPAQLTGAQRKRLRALANPLKAVVHVGDAGLADGVIRNLDQALEAHELVKVRLRRPADKKADARELAHRTGAHLCGLVGHTVILYRQNEENPRIELEKSEN